MIILVMALLGSGLGLAAAAIERRLMTSPLRKTPGAIPPWQTLLAIAVVYLGWATIRLTATREPSLDAEWVTFASLLYALIHVDVALQVLRMIGGPFAARMHKIAVACAQPAVRALVVAALLVLVVATWSIQGELTGTTVWWASLVAGVAALVLQAANVKRWPGSSESDPLATRRA